jgi:proton-coupled amino acid transporter
MREPHKFPRALTGVMFFLTCLYLFNSVEAIFNFEVIFTVLFGGAGVLAYLTFGSDIKTVVLVNLDPENKMVLIVSTLTNHCSVVYREINCLLHQVQFIYSLAILLSVPLQLFPAVRILENGLFIRSGKSDNRVKWMKNFFRFFMVMFCTAVSSWGAQDLDKFVAFVGCFAWSVSIYQVSFTQLLKTFTLPCQVSPCVTSTPRCCTIRHVQGPRNKNWRIS